MTRYLTLLIPCLLLIACAKPTTLSPHVDDQAVAEETAYQKGVAGKGGQKFDAPVDMNELAAMKTRLAATGARVSEAGKTLCRNMNRDPNGCVFTFEIKVEPALNAYADGSTIFVTPAMMRFAADEDSLALVLSHEYAHNIMGHVQSQQMNGMAGMAVGTIADVIASSQGYSTGGQFSQLGASAAAQAYSPKFEEEADYVGLYIMAIGGYDITHAAGLWRRMTEADPDGAFFNGSHPSNPHRYVLLENTKNEIVEKVQKNILLAPNIKAKK